MSLRGRGDKTAQGWQQGRRVDWKGHPSREIRDPDISTLHPQTPETQHEAANPNPPAPDGGSEVAVETSPQRSLGLGSGRGQRCWSWRGRGACRPVAVEPASLWQQSSRGTDTSPVDADPGPAVRRQRVARSHTQSGRRPGGRAVPSPGRKVESTFFSSSCNGLCQQTGEKPPGARAAAGKGLNQVQQPPTARGPSRVEAERAPAPGRAPRTARGRRPLLGKGLPVSPLTPRPRPGHPAPLSAHSALPRSSRPCDAGSSVPGGGQSARHPRRPATSRWDGRVSPGHGAATHNQPCLCTRHSYWKLNLNHLP